MPPFTLRRIFQISKSWKETWSPLGELGEYVRARVPLIARSWDPGSEEVETQGGNGRKWEEMGERERERERVLKSVAFVCKMI